jgi:hypothetical protein
MAFDIAKFDQQQFRDRTADIAVPELKTFFDDGEKPVWVVRCLTAEELAAANEAVENNRNIEHVIGALSAGAGKEKVEAVKEAMGLPTDKAPSDLVRRFSMLVSGSVSPACPQNIAVKLAHNFPTTFYKLTNEIIRLTGAGRVGE